MYATLISGLLLCWALCASALEYGQTAPDFTLTDTWDNTHTLSDYRGRVVYINFFGCT